MYIPGKLKHNNKVMVDIGTGYYVEKVAKYTLASSLLQCIDVFLVCERSWGILPTSNGPYH